MQNNFSLIILGATGDLAQKKLFPALHGLIRMKKIGDDFCVVAVGRKGIGREEFAEMARQNIKPLHEESWNTLKERLYYFQLDFDAENGFVDLGKFLEGVESAHNTQKNRLFYLATLPEHFSKIAHKIRKNGLAQAKENWCRVVFEKPFGRDRKSAKALNREIKAAFDEKEIYRIDHYLGKELVQNISVLRSCNRIFDPLWNREHIDHVQINLIENFGVENRGAFYDKQGALRDVGQSHLLQLLCLTAMETPKNLDEKCIRNEKVRVLRSIKPVSKNGLVLGQYEGYLGESGVAKGSGTETYFALRLFLGGRNWKGVPFYLRSGKNLDKRFASIYVQFKSPDRTALEHQKVEPNYLLIQIQPDDGILVRLNGKVPGEKMGIQPVKMTFCHECTFGPNTPQAYETLILNTLEGDQSAFLREDEIDFSWKVIDQVRKLGGKAHTYAKGTTGPREADAMIERDGRKWFNRIENVLQGL